jgi:hypothetical protein
MKNYEIYLNKKGIETIYIESNNNNSDVRNFLDFTEEKKLIFIIPRIIGLKRESNQNVLKTI